MSRERDERILESLWLKSEDPNIPMAERVAFREKANDIRRRLGKGWTSEASRQDFNKLGFE